MVIIAYTLTNNEVFEMINISRVATLFFSPTDCCATLARSVSRQLAAALSAPPPTEYDITLPAARQQVLCFGPGQLLIAALPVYAGRVPNILLPYLHTLRGDGAMALPLVVYGNRDFDDALLELADILTEQGFFIPAAAAFIGEHAFSRTLAAGRPDAADLTLAASFARQAAAKLHNGDHSPARISGCRPYRLYYMPKDEQGRPVDIRKIKPHTGSACNHCGLCAALCPMASIDSADSSLISGICIKCGACIKKCPQQAKSFTDMAFVRHKQELEQQFRQRQEPQLFF